MFKFTQYLVDGAYMLAMQEMECIANSFSFRRDVPTLVDECLLNCPDAATVFATAFVESLATAGTDGRNECCANLAKRIVLCECLPKVDKARIAEIGSPIRYGRMHRTVQQQAAQFAFAFLGAVELIPAPIADHDGWWKMPLI